MVGLAGNGYQGADGKGSWDTTLIWKANEIVEFSFDCGSGKLVTTNITTGLMATFTFTDKDFSKINYYFAFSVWKG